MTTSNAVPGGLPVSSPDATERQERLAGRVHALRARGTLFQPSDRWMLYLGGALVPLGVVLVLLGWYGASHTVLLFEQVPYLISGGLLGLALVFGGGFTYFAYWLTVLVRENRTERQELQAVLLRMEALMQDSAHPRTHRTAPGSYTGRFVATRTGTMLHRPDCVAVDGRDNLRDVTPDTPGLTPCRLCDPLDEG